MTGNQPLQDAPAESSEGRFRRATIEWGHLLEGGILLGSLWQDRLGGRVRVHCLSLAGPSLSAVVTVRRADSMVGPLLSYPLSEFCAYDRLSGGQCAYRFSRVLTKAEIEGK